MADPGDRPTRRREHLLEEQLAAARRERDRYLVALAESVKLQSHYAALLNMHDGGRRIGFDTVDAWLARLVDTGTLPR